MDLHRSSFFFLPFGFWPESFFGWLAGPLKPQPWRYCESCWVEYYGNPPQSNSSANALVPVEAAGDHGWPWRFCSALRSWVQGFFGCFNSQAYGNIWKGHDVWWYGDYIYGNDINWISVIVSGDFFLIMICMVMICWIYVSNIDPGLINP